MMPHRQESINRHNEMINVPDSNRFVDRAETKRIFFLVFSCQGKKFTSFFIFSISVRRYRFRMILASEFLQLMPM